MKTFIGLLASATARPQRSEDSQAGGCPRKVNRRFGQEEECYHAEMMECGKLAAQDHRNACGIYVNKRYEVLKDRRERGGGGAGRD